MTTIELAGSGTVGFSNGSTGYVYPLPGGAPQVGELDVLCVNSNTVVATPAGFTAAPTRVATQGAYIYRRMAVGGEGSTVTITTTGDWPTTVTWSRWRNVGVADIAVSSGADLSPGTSTPAVSTGGLARQNELVIAYVALHDLLAGSPTSPVWSAGYTPLAAGAVVGGAGSGVASFSGYRVDAGTGAEAPQVSWTNATNDRYMLVLTVTPLVTVDAGVGSVEVFGTSADINIGMTYPTGLDTSPGTVEVSGTTATLTMFAADVAPLMGGTVTVRMLSGSATVS